MKVYIVEVQYDYEGSDFVGVFSSEKNADSVKSVIDWGDRVVVKEYKLDETDQSVLH